MKINKITSNILMLLLFCSSITFAQSNELLKESALRDAKIVSASTLKMDFETVLKHTYPPILKLMGGKEKAVELLNTTFSSMKEQGFVFEKAEIKNVSKIIQEQDVYRCYVEGFNQMVMNGMRIKSKSYLLGIYNETDKFWYFIEAKQLKNQQMLDMVLPNFKTSLVIPDDEVTTEGIQD